MNDQVSALVDGELSLPDADSCLDRVCKDGDLRRQWALFHMIGDQLRRETVALPILFSQRVSARLAAEPTRRAAHPAPRQFSLSLAASLVGMAVVVGAVLAIYPQRPVQLAVAPIFMPAEMLLARRSIPEDSRDYLIAHQGVSPSGTLQGVGAYMRTLSDTGSGNGIQEK
jgi:sigma-E factor negative regulatory protein RseA